MGTELEQGLLKHLENLGFEDRKLWEAVRTRAGLGIPDFTVRHFRWFDDDLMCYLLHFEQNASSTSSYNLLKYEVKYLPALWRERKEINGVDTASLEYTIRSVDWERVDFDMLSGDVDPGRMLYEAELKGILTELWRLSENDNQEGRNLQDVFRLLYFTGTPLELPKNNPLCQELEKQQRISYGNYHAIRAYYDVSRRTEALAEILRNAGFPYLEDKISQAMLQAQETFSLRVSLWYSMGVMHFTIPCERHGGGYRPSENYSAGLVYHPPIVHGHFNNVDTWELEKEMLNVDWSDDYSNCMEFEDGSVVYSEKVTSILEKMAILSREEAGRKIVDLLQLKYWTASPDFDSLISAEARKYYNTLPAVKDRFHFSVNPFIAYQRLLAAHPGPQQQLNTANEIDAKKKVSLQGPPVRKTRKKQSHKSGKGRKP